VKRIVGCISAVLLPLAPLGAQQPAYDAIGPMRGYAALVPAVERTVERTMRQMGIPGMSIALVADDEVVWARGFGLRDTRDSALAGAHTAYAIGDASALFTTLAVLRLAERGALRWGPVAPYVSGLAPTSSYSREITIAHLLTHQSGLVREPPSGGPMDTMPRTIADAVRSLNQTSLVVQPGSRRKYSNSGMLVAAAAVEGASRLPYERYLTDELIRPLELTGTGFAPDSAAAFAAGTTQTYDGRSVEAPGTRRGPAPTRMYSTVADLGRLVARILAGRVLGAEQTRLLWAPAAVSTDDTGNDPRAVEIIDGVPAAMWSSSSAGFTTRIAVLPASKIGVVVATSVGGAEAITRRIATQALEAVRMMRLGGEIPRGLTTTSIAPSVARDLAGTYESLDDTVEVLARDTIAYLWRFRGSTRGTIRAVGGLPQAGVPALIVDDKLAVRPSVAMRGSGGAAGIALDSGPAFRRMGASIPADVPARWRGLIGEYGTDANTVYLLERTGRLSVLVDWFYEFPLTEVGVDRFVMPNRGRYAEEPLVVHRDATGRATQLTLGGTVLMRRSLQGEDGSTFRITPLAPPDSLRRIALAASPPVERGDFLKSDLAELVRLDSTIQLDIRYASTNNFLGTPLYSQARAFLQRPAAEALVRAHKALAKAGYGLLIHDGYRPWYVTKMFWDATPNDKKIFVADPSQGSRHNRGAAVDLTLYDLATGRPVVMTGGYDEMSERSYPDYPGGTSRQRWYRELLRGAMEAQGFHVYEAEWWHFDYGEWRRYPIGNARFEDLGIR
jgi:D-alanyl-D-alanine dipeptidase/CubicO group peptidase (beta-lactamase class C family)